MRVSVDEREYGKLLNWDVFIANVKVLDLDECDRNFRKRGKIYLACCSSDRNNTYGG